MRTISIKVYQYKELSETAKAKAREWYLEGMDFQFEWDNTKEDAENIGLNLLGLDRGSMQGDFIESALDCAERIMKEHGEHCETYKTAKEYWSSLQSNNEDEREDAEQEFRRAILEDYRIMSERDYEYAQSEEAIAESMEANEYEFTIDGKRF